MNQSLKDLGEAFPHISKSYLATVAIDFGTTYSGFAFSFNKGGVTDSIFMNRVWINEQGHRSMKTPTSLLLKPDQSFHSFGYDAEATYFSLKSVLDEKEYWFFQHFKMYLHNDESLCLDTMIRAANGKHLKAKTVFAHAIKFLKEEALQMIRMETKDEGYKMEDIQWVLTVPAIWTPKAKQFMREAAYEAGIGSRENPKQLMIALEPEAAAVFCTEKNLAEPLSDKQTTLEGKSQYMVVDIGGGTLDVTVHENLDDGFIKESYKVTGGPYGGMKVNYQFQTLLDEMFGDQKLYDYRQHFPSDWLKIIDDFEMKKRTARSLEGKDSRIRLPRSFLSYINDSRSKELKQYDSGDVRILNEEYLCLSPTAMMRLFEPVLKAMKDHLRVLLSKPQLSKVQVMLLVGGFADCLLLQKEIKKEFSRRCRVIVPPDPSIAVVQGAVMFGNKPSKITQRVLTTTYGADCTEPFVKGVHPEEKKFLADGKEMCEDIFSCFVKENDVVRLGQKVKKTFNPVRKDQTKMKWAFYASDHPDAEMITERGVTRIGTIEVQSPDTKQGLNRKLELSMYFGGTEITATARDIASGNMARTTFDFFQF